MKVLAITRPKTSLEKSKEVVKDYGFDFFAAPTIELFPHNSEELDKLKKSVRDGEADFVVFTSKNGVKFFFEELEGINLVKDLDDCRIVSIGPKTAEKLRDYGIDAEVPEKYSSSGLVNYLSNDVGGKRVEIARSSHGSEVLVNGLRENNAIVHDVALYSIGLPNDVSEIKELIDKTLKDKIDVLTFTSKMTFVNLIEVAENIGEKNELIKKMNEITVAAIGEPTKSKIKDFGVSNVLCPEDYTFENMIKTVVNEN